MTVVTVKHVAIAELVIYIPTALVTLLVVLRHGFHKQLGWIYLFIFSGIRIAGAVLEIISEKHPDNASDVEWAIILQSVGLSPLLLSSLGLLKRVYENIHNFIYSEKLTLDSFDEICQHGPSSPGSRHHMLLQELSAVSGIARKLVEIYSKKATAISGRSKIVQLLHIPSLIALILSIMGGTDQASSNPSDHAGGKTETRVGIIIFLAVYIALCMLWLTTIKDLNRMVSSQKRIIGVVLMALPLIACRLLYSLISGFSHDRRFSLVSGDVTIRLCMATIEEFLVVLMYTILGILTPRSDANKLPSSPQQWPYGAEDPESHTPIAPRSACDRQKYEPVGLGYNHLQQ